MGPTWMVSVSSRQVDFFLPSRISLNFDLKRQEFAQASRNAASRIRVSERKSEHAMCSVHISGRWMEKNRGRFKDYGVS